jgi:quinol monooxygenase YgiN
VKRVLVRYRVKPDQTERNEQLVRAVYEELHRTEPIGFRYATFRLDDGVTFVHIHSRESDADGQALGELESFKDFQKDIAERCEEKPVVSELHEVGSFRFFEGS